MSALEMASPKKQRIFAAIQSGACRAADPIANLITYDSAEHHRDKQPSQGDDAAGRKNARGDQEGISGKEKADEETRKHTEAVAERLARAGARIEEVRGVNCESVLGNLELRDLITEVGRGSGPGQPKLYGTTMRFLQVTGIESLDHLPTPSDGAELLERGGADGNVRRETR